MNEEERPTLSHPVIQREPAGWRTVRVVAILTLVVILACLAIRVWLGWRW